MGTVEGKKQEKRRALLELSLIHIFGRGQIQGQIQLAILEAGFLLPDGAHHLFAAGKMCIRDSAAALQPVNPDQRPDLLGRHRRCGCHQ